MWIGNMNFNLHTQVLGCGKEHHDSYHENRTFTVPSAVRRPFRMSPYAPADGHTMFDEMNCEVVCKSNWRPNFILHVLCHPELHFRSLSMTCDVERTALCRGYSKWYKVIEIGLAGLHFWGECMITLQHHHSPKLVWQGDRCCFKFITFSVKSLWS
jgi:hypothetical protein